MSWDYTMCQIKIKLAWTALFWCFKFWCFFLLFFWLIIQAYIHLYLFLENASTPGTLCKSPGFCNSEQHSFLGFPHPNGDIIVVWEASDITISHCPCFAAKNWAHLVQCYWRPYHRPLWFFRGGWRSLLSPRQQLAGFCYSFISQV